MAKGLSIDLRNKILSRALGISNIAQPAAVYLALGTSDFTEDGSGSGEVTTVGTAYARAPITAWGDSTNGVLTASNITAFAEATLDWGSITHWAIFNDLTATGSSAIMAFGELDALQLIQSGNTASIDPAEIVITMPCEQMSYALADLVLDYFFDGDVWTYPTTTFVGLQVTAEPADGTSTVDEEDGAGYERFTFNGTTNWNTPAAGSVTNKLDIEFPVATGDWDVGGAKAMFIARSGTEDTNDLLFWGTMDQIVESGDQVKSTAGKYTITLTTTA